VHDPQSSSSSHAELVFSSGAGADDMCTAALALSRAQHSRLPLEDIRGPFNVREPSLGAAPRGAAGAGAGAGAGADGAAAIGGKGRGRNTGTAMGAGAGPSLRQRPQPSAAAHRMHSESESDSDSD
jgi:hypothetical protein